MTKRILAIVLTVALLISVPTALFAAEEPSVSSVEISANKTGFFSNLKTKLTLFKIFGNNRFYNNQWQSIETLSKLNDDLYLMDYQYEYDIDDLLERGTDSIVDLLLYCSGHLYNNKVACLLNECGFACSAFACTSDSGDRLMGRNFDFKDAPTLVVWTDPEDGYASVSMVDTNMMLLGDLNKPRASVETLQLMLAPYIPMDGMNEAGLSIGVLQVKADATAQDTGSTDIITTVAIRAALDKCATVEEVIALFSQFDMHDMMSGRSFHYCVSDATGVSAVIEYIDNEMKVTYAESNGSLAVTNFFLVATGTMDTPEGEGRYNAIVEALEQNNGTLSEVAAMQLLNTVHLDYKHKTGLYQITSLYSALYNNTDRYVSLCARLNYSDIYRFSATAPMQVELVNASADIETWTAWEN